MKRKILEAAAVNDDGLEMKVGLSKEHDMESNPQ